MSIHAFSKIYFYNRKHTIKWHIFEPVQIRTWIFQNGNKLGIFSIYFLDYK